MPSPFNLEPEALAPVLRAAIQRLGEVGSPGMEALIDHLRREPACPAFDTGYDLLFGWMAEHEVDNQTSGG